MNTWKISAVLVCVLLASILVLAAPQQPSAIVVIQGATLINGTGNPAIRNSAIVIEGGKIRDIGPRNEIRVRSRPQISLRVHRRDEGSGGRSGVGGGGRRRGEIQGTDAADDRRSASRAGASHASRKFL